MIGNGCFIFSPPRTGSHLLIDLLQSIWYEEVSNRGEILLSLRSCAYPSNKVMHGGHIPPTQTIFDLIKTTGFVPVVMTRDPKDMIVSYAHYMQKNIKTFKEKAIQSPWSFFVGKTIEESMDLLITGIEGELVSIVEWYRRFFLLKEDTFLQDHGIPIIAYEDLVQDPVRTIESLSGYLRINPSDQQLSFLSTVVGKEGSFFFRSGKIGEWKVHFTENHTQLFDNVWRNR